ncbi:MAG TPA: UDP-N-acetylmuramoyl-tripeptide--D-alanyl-D-alanine ligase [Blastocatellia bacterium]|nr:UDP-N-acetylmuramoyl-tripeptide--D-alanyl-D-alanine ligase [Blastocatellia bacterium]
MKLGEIVSILRAKPIAAGEREPSGYSIDSRTIRAGDLFFAIRGEKHDGHRFVADVFARGAIAAVVARDFLNSDAARGLGENAARLIAVNDTLVALQSVASSVIKSWRGRLVAVTGSAGKTTTKDLTAAVLARLGRVIKTTGNLNNAYGLPLSILKMESDGARAADFDFAVLEMGMNHKGELAELTRIAPPDLGLVTNVAAVHLEFFSSVDEIAEAKAELVQGVKPGGAAVLNADDERVARMRSLRDDIEVRTFGIEHPAGVRASEIRSSALGSIDFLLTTPRGSVETRLPLIGRHNLYNALAAAAVADYYGAPLEQIADALAHASSSKMRGEVLRCGQGFTLIDDSYNSNPRALVEMVRTVSASEGYGRKIVVAGEMLELGEAGAALHREAGRQIAGLGIDWLIGVRGLAGELVAGARESGMAERAAIFCATPEEAAELLEREVRAGDLILVKGSRGVKMETVVERLKSQEAGGRKQ